MRLEALLAQAHEVPLLDQGSVQFILLGVMILAVLFVLWITIAEVAAGRTLRPVSRHAATTATAILRAARDRSCTHRCPGTRSQGAQGP